MKTNESTKRNNLIFIALFLMFEAFKWVGNLWQFYISYLLQIIIVASVIINFVKERKIFKKLAQSITASLTAFSLVMLLIIPIVRAVSVTIMINSNFKAYVIHAGGGSDGISYLNCKEYFEYYVANGYEYIELDFMFSSDQEIICTHSFEYLEGYDENNRPTLQEFEEYLLLGQYHGITFDWLIEKLNEYPNVKIVFDTKESDEVQLIEKLVEQALEYDFDIFSRFIIQVYSYEEYLNIKQNENLKFKEFWYSNYKSVLTLTEILEYFEDKEDVTTLVLSTSNWEAMSPYLYKTSKKIAVFTVNDEKTKYYYKYNGVNYIYTDEVTDNIYFISFQDIFCY